MIPEVSPSRRPAALIGPRGLPQMVAGLRACAARIRTISAEAA